MNDKQNVLFIIPPLIPFEAFINPPPYVKQIKKEDGKFYGNLLTDMPLGVLSISAFVKKHLPINIELIDFNVELNLINKFKFNSFNEYFRFFFESLNQQKKYDIIGISTNFSPAYQNMLILSKVCKNIFHDSLIVGGGHIPTNMYKQIFQEENHGFDALCFGEGELAFLELVSTNDKFSYLKKSNTWITKEKVDKKFVFQHNFIENLDDIPFPDYDLCKLEYYGINPAIKSYGPHTSNGREFHVMTSRGCPFNCIFCASHRVHGKKVRYFSLKRVKEDLKKLKEKYNAIKIIFQDDHFMGDYDRAYKIIEYIKELNLTPIFQNGLALYALDKKILKLIKEAGGVQLNLSVESGSERVLKEIIHKPLNLKIVKRVINDCIDLGIYTSINILIGFPGETKKDIEEERKFLKDIKANWYLIFCATPLPGSELEEISKQKGYLLSNYLNNDFKQASIETEEFSAEYIQEMMYIMNLELNFVENSDMKRKDYKTALIGFEKAIKAKYDHAFAYYFGSICYEELNMQEKAKKYKELAYKYSKTAFWKKYFQYFKITINS